MADGTTESYAAYALCYRCHERSSILGDASFRGRRQRTTATGGGHGGHLASGASCATCHDPHGVAVAGGLGADETGDHTHLVNFDKRVVLSKDGAGLRSSMTPGVQRQLHAGLSRRPRPRAVPRIRGRFRGSRPCRGR
jgi:hypothetical protein